MALNDKLNLDLSQARRETLRLGSQLDRIIENRSLNLKVNLTGLDSELLQARQQATAAFANIQSLAFTGAANFEGDVAAGAKVKQNLNEIAEAEERAARQGDLLNAQWRRLAVTAATLFGAREIKEFFEGAAKAASDTVESVNAVFKVFDDSSGVIEEFVVGAEQLGFSAIQARDAAVRFGGLFQAFKFPQDEAAEFSNRLTQISADLSSIYNRDPDEAARALFGVFRGEPEPARVFGLSITAAAIEAKALEDGLVATKSEIDETTKALATFALIEEQTANITNDFADTLATSLPNQLRVLQAEFANSQARIGEQFQEPLLEGIKAIRAQVIPQLEEAFSRVDFGGLVQGALPQFVDFVEVIIESLPSVLEVANALGGIFSGLVGVGADLAGFLGPEITQLAAVAITADRAEAAFGKLGSSTVLAADGFRRITADGADVSQKITGITESVVAGALAFGPWGALAGAGFGVATLAIDAMQDEQLRAFKAQEAFTEAVQEANPEVLTLAESIIVLRDAYADLPAAADEATEEIVKSEGLIALETTLAGLSQATQKSVGDFRAAGGDIDAIAAGIETGLDIFGEKRSEDGFQFFLDTEGLDAALVKLEEVAAASDDPRIRAAVAAFLETGRAAGFSADQYGLLADAIDESADTVDSARQTREEETRATVIAGAATDFYYQQVVDLAEQLEDTSTAPYTEALERVTTALKLAEDEQAEMLFVTGRLSAEFDRGIPSVLGFQASLEDLAAVDVQIALDREQIEEALSESFAAELQTRLKEIEDQLTIRVNIDEKDSINDIQEIVDEAEKTLDTFNARNAAAAELDLLGLDDLSRRVAAGEFDGIIDEVLKGNAADLELLKRAEQTLEDVAVAQQRAAAEQAELFKIEYAKTLLNGENDPYQAWLEGIELDPEDFVRFGREMSALLSGRLNNDEVARQREADGRGVASAFLQGLEDEFGSSDDVEAAARGMAARIEAAVKDELGIQSPSLRAIEIGEFFDEGLAEGLLGLGHTKEAAEVLAQQILSIRGTLETGIRQAFVPEIDEPEVVDVVAQLNEIIAGGIEGFIPEENRVVEEQQLFLEVFEGIREAANAAAAEVDSLRKVEEDRAAALARLDQFGDYDNLRSAVESGAADELLKRIIFAPSASAFQLIEDEINRASRDFGVDPFGLFNEAESIEQAKRYGVEWSFAATEAQLQGLTEGEGAVNALLAEQTEENLRRLNNDWNDPIVAQVDATASVAEIESNELSLTATVDVEGFTIGGTTVPGFDKGGVAYDTMFAVAERGHPEMIAGMHHRGEDVWKWMNEIGLDRKVEPFYAERFERAFSAPSAARHGWSAVVDELKSVRTELAEMKAHARSTAGNTAVLPDISDNTDVSARVALRAETATPRGPSGGWKDGFS